MSRRSCPDAQDASLGYLYIYYTFLHTSIHPLCLHSDRNKQTNKRPLQNREKRVKGGMYEVNEGEAAGKHADANGGALVPLLHTHGGVSVGASRLTYRIKSFKNNKNDSYKTPTSGRSAQSPTEKQQDAKNTPSLNVATPSRLNAPGWKTNKQTHKQKKTSTHKKPKVLHFGASWV